MTRVTLATCQVPLLSCNLLSLPQLLYRKRLLLQLGAAS